ncbi:S8 family serine peptidase [Neolewinella lacunae]|uniref:S8 family serine peptidase n=1 Tax=Neolewinella lacunae TaxID=1517758 RepID=A0A923PST4_9BACT|nr:S8 family serine peptidase [Neolewinella lacunae]MBC6996843.1 S8 family serine peptidase [Neolewinella lacunae]MDN3633821.1 S8 family serine peptidase [Neolewinella lacunae]
MLYLAALLLCIWFWRRNFKDSTLWMLATYAGVGLLLWRDYDSASTLNEAIPRIVRDFMLIGMVGLVQSLAVARRVPIWLAIVIILGIFVAAHFLQGMAGPGALEASNAPALPADAEFLVEAKEGPAGQAFAQDAARLGWTITPAFQPQDAASTYLDNYFVVDVADVALAESQLAGLASVAYFEPNEIIVAEPLVAEPVEANKQNPALGINDPDTDQQWAMEALNMDAYYRLLASQTPRKKARIAILDTGVDAAHEDLRANYFSVESKYDNDPMGHGTHCAGIAAGVTNNGIGIGSLAGTGRGAFVEVTSIKVLGSGGMGTQKSIIAGIIEAADEGVDVISLSLGGPSNQSRQQAYSQAIKYATRHGAIVIAAAGNSNRDAANYSPANAQGIIAVAAIDQHLLRAPFSNKVNNLAQGIAAPGVAIFSTTPNSKYAAYSGTSMACPFVAGLLGVMRSVNPDLTAAQAYRILQQTGKDGAETAYTGRIVQPAAALQAALSR